MIQLLIRRPHDERLELLEIHPSGSYFDENRVLWDQRSGNPFPSEHQAELIAAQEYDSGQQVQAEAAFKAKNYLASTDWYVVRKAETGKPIPQEILDARAQARIDAEGGQ